MPIWPDLSILLNESETAEILGLRKSTLRTWRYLGRGTAFVKVGLRSIRYERSEIADYIRQGRIQTTE